MCLTLPRPRENSRLLVALAVVAAVPSGCAPAQQPAFTVKHDIAMVRFNDPTANVNALENDSDNFSSDRKHVAIVTTRGLLATDQLRSEITVFDTAEIDRFLVSRSGAAPKPRLVASITAISQGQQTIAYAAIIHDLRWNDDGTRIYFRGQNERGGYQLYEARTDGGGCRPLTSSAFDVDHYDVAGETIAYTASPIDAPPQLPGVPINRDAYDATDVRSKDILFPGLLRPWAVKTFSMFTLRVGAHPLGPRQVPRYAVDDNSFFHHLFPFQLSPDGHWLISAEPIEGKVPKAWEAFDPTPLFERRRLRTDDSYLTRPGNVLRPRRYVLIHLGTGVSRVLLDAPSAEYLGYAQEANEAMWSRDGTRVLITNVYLPPQASTDQKGAFHPAPCAVASVDVPSLRSRCLYFNEASGPPNGQHLLDAQFGKRRDEIVVTLRGQADGVDHTVFHLRDGAWEPDPRAGKDPEESHPSQLRQSIPRVYIKQDLNEIPTLWASDPLSKATRQLWDPNPQLHQLAFGQASVLRWKDSSGREWFGGLVKPVGYVAGHRYPLVLQMYNFRQHEFLTDGTDPSAFTARHLASVGFVVLQIQKQGNTLSEEDPQTSLEGYQSAIERLSDDGLVDPHRVGVVGFSWTCWYVVNSLIKAPKLFAAATIADGLDNSYMQYMLGAPSNPDIEGQMNQIKGSSPFGQGLERWVAAAPGFHLDQVETPVRIEAIDPDSVLQEWELYGSLFMQHKPVDLIYFPDGTHIHQMPLERLESQQGNVDWMRFWLQNYEDPDPSKKAQYLRWRGLRPHLLDSSADAIR
jgi:dipeptidyl aminopeptidase/acylaminoacyl peptidase